MTTVKCVGAAPGPVTEWALGVLHHRVARTRGTCRTSLPRCSPRTRSTKPGPPRSPTTTTSARLASSTYSLPAPPRTLPMSSSPTGRLIERHILDSGDKWRYERALKLLPPLHAAHRALGDDEGWNQYLDALRDRHRTRPTFLRTLDVWQDSTTRTPARRGRRA